MKLQAFCNQNDVSIKSPHLESGQFNLVFHHAAALPVLQMFDSENTISILGNGNTASFLRHFIGKAERHFL